MRSGLKLSLIILTILVSLSVGRLAYGLDEPELVIRDAVTETFGGYYTARVIWRTNSQDYEIFNRNTTLPKDLAISAYRVWVQLPHDTLYLSVPNTRGPDLQWWVQNSRQQMDPTLANDIRENIITAYRRRTKHDTSNDFILRQLESRLFDFHIESLTISSDTTSGQRAISEAERQLHGGALTQAPAIYAGFDGDLAQTRELDENFRFDSKMVPTTGSPTDLKVGQMWVDRRNNFVVILGTEDRITGVHYTQAHPFYFGNLNSPDFYQVYTVGGKKSHDGLRYEKFQLILADRDNVPSPRAVLEFDKAGVVTVGTSENSVYLTDANTNQRWIVSQNLKSGRARLHNLPDHRSALHVYKLTGTKTYIYIDAPAFSRAPESYQMWIGTPGNLAPLPILHIDYIDNKPARFHTAQGILRVASELETSGSSFNPVWDTPEQVYELDPEKRQSLVQLRPTLEQLGVDLNRLSTKKFPSPCDLFLKKTTKLRTVI